MRDVTSAGGTQSLRGLRQHTHQREQEGYYESLAAIRRHKFRYAQCALTTFIPGGALTRGRRKLHWKYKIKQQPGRGKKGPGCRVVWEGNASLPEV